MVKAGFDALVKYIKTHPK
jgi:hypothetical protein